MKTVIKNIALFASLLAVGCSTSLDESVGVLEEGLLTMSVEMNSEVTTRSSGDEAASAILESGVLKIYNSNDELVRYYSGVSETISDYLAVGNYSVQFKAGTAVSATFDSGSLSYYGESGTVAVESNKTTAVDIDVTIQNVIFSVAFDEATLDSHFEDYSVVAYAADSFDEVTSDTPKLTYVVDGDSDGYFVLPDGVSNIVWQFISGDEVEASGTIEGAKMAYQYKVSFKYTDYLDVSSLSITVEETEDFDDSFNFKVQPVITGSSFDMEVVQNYLGSESSYQMSVSSISEVYMVDVYVGTDVYSTVVGTESTNGVSYDAESCILTLSGDVFDNIATGGIHTIEIDVTDTNGATGTADMQVGITGLSGFANEDMWYNTADIEWYVATEATSVELQYRYKGDETWSDAVVATTTDGHSWSAENTVEWTSSTNSSGFTIYALTRGILPSKDYEVRATVDGTTSDLASITSSATTQTIPDGDLDNSSLSCFTTSNTNSTFWASGNNDTTKGLCSYFTDGDIEGAYLKTSYVNYIVYSTYAAGNLYTGCFDMGSTTGDASFGQKFDWVARPQSLNVNYKSTVGSGDKNLIFIAIVDWSSRHVVTAGIGDPSGTWDPVSQNSTDEGKIIGYGYVTLDSSQSTYTDLEIPIYYYDKETKPSSNNYSIVISTSASYRGDYGEGSDDSAMWFNEFNFGY